MLLVQFVENGDLNLCGAIVQDSIKHAASSRHFWPYRSQHPGKPLRAPGGLEARERPGSETPYFVAPGVEQMAAEEKPQRGLFLRQAGLQIPWRHFGQLAFDDIVGIVRKQRDLIGAALGLLGRFNGVAHRSKQGGPVLFDLIEGSGTNKRFDAATIDTVPVDPAAEVKQAGVRPAFLTGTDDLLYRALARALDGPQTVAHGARRLAAGRMLIGHRLKSVSRRVDIRWEDLHAVGKGILPEDLDLVGIVHIGRQGGRQKLGWMMGLEPGCLV